ncbi:uncharacterized protein LOC124111983 isoform X2 [Haliotis rufescens]|uniref:uncharacterized protein LOC124111983 isoform X2 n=1 Tax=Haliotis rufescens TaxID=6454 RepID=UPI00201E77C9|nr:uncharacterized protein LOC124111983 isoform X2 [Haliotis rufescens]
MLLTWLFVCWGAVICRGIQTDQISVGDATSNWWDAHSRCSHKEGSMYTPGSDDIQTDILGHLQPDTYYWIGAMTYLAWIWTVDGSPLYRYAGFLPLGDVTYTWTVDYLDNSVWKCHLYCSSYSSMGMQGNTCYCLNEGYGTVGSSTTENRCRGNIDELCGNVDGMSVYKLDLGHDECGGSGCVSLRLRHKKKWYGASTDCSLVKLNAPVQNNLLTIMPINKKYWIGLYKLVHRKWLHGQRALIYDGYMHFPDTDTDTLCLTIYRLNNGSTRLYWIACDLDQRWICENVKESITSTKMTPTSSSSHPSSASTLSEDVSTVPGNHSSNRSSPADAGGYIGLGVGSVVLVVLAVLIVVFLLRRQEKLCFERRDGNQPIHFTSGAENTTYGLAVQAGNEAYSVITPPDIDRTSTSSTVPTAIVRPNAHNDNIYINTSQINDEDEYSVLSESDNSKKVMPHGNPYNHLSGPDRGNKSKGDYDTANCVPQAGEATTGMKHMAADTRLSDAASGQNLEEGQYNVLGQHDSPRTADADAGVYDHVAADEGDYDTALQGKNPSKVDDTYSHIQRTNTECEEDAYDVASKRQPEGCSDDTYDHATKIDEEDRDTADYYNTKCLLQDDGNLDGHPGGDDRSDENDQENVYSLAKDISYA